MSGIVGIVHLDGRPVDQRLLRKMTDFLAFRGPDAQETWIDGNAGFGHTMLRTTWEAEHERQPCTLDNEVWITADARIDDRQNLIDRLVAKGRLVPSTAPDVELILHAYHMWGEDCVEQLLGDFSFVIWDSRLKRVFCARDHLGVKPFYYFYWGSTFVFSNTLNCIRQHPDVSDELNDLAIADFLLFELNQEPTTTTFADIQRVPPAHTVIVSSDGLRTRRYWSMPVDEPIYYKKSLQYLERFGELLNEAVRDRMRTPWVGVFMSGGIDSSTLAATACRLSERPPALSVTAFTNVFDWLIPDDERHYSGLVASRLGIPIDYRVLDGEVINRQWDQAPPQTPEPACYAFPRAEELKYLRMLSKYGRVFLYGEGPDNALRYEWRPHLFYLARKGLWTKLIGDVFRHVIAHRRLPLVPTILGAAGKRPAMLWGESRFPAWLDEELVSRLDLRARWEAAQLPGASTHPTRPSGYGSFATLLWQDLFDRLDPAFTEAPLEVRHPFVDLRLLRYMLAIPALPWCRRKYLLRSAMRGILPEEVLRRDKAPLVSDPTFEAARRMGIPPPVLTPEILRYINSQKVNCTVSDDVQEFLLNLRPVVVNHWLQNLRKLADLIRGDGRHEFSGEAESSRSG